MLLISIAISLIHCFCLFFRAKRFI